MPNQGASNGDPMVEPDRQLFLPRSIIETSKEEIEARRQERDIHDLDVRICFYSDRAPQDIPIINSQILQEKLDLPKGYLLCINTRKQGESLLIPDEVLEALQKEFSVKLANKQYLPPDLRGYAFHVAPLPTRKARGFRMALNGDGTIYRLGFEDGKVALKSRIPKTPDYYADRATQDNYCLAFRDGGLARTSIPLGNPDQLNTAFLATREHLLLTFDAGRPYILDPVSLELIEPVGNTQEWLSMFPGVPLPFIFYGMQSPAHPVFDVSNTSSDRDEFFTANYSTGYNGWLKCIVNMLFSLLFWINKLIKLWDVIRGKEKFSCKGYQSAYTDLLRYQFRHAEEDAKLERWRLVHRDSGKPVAIKQTLHQMGITKDYIILTDISFKMEFSQIFSPFLLGWLHWPCWESADWLKERRKRWGSRLSSIFLRLIKPKPLTNLYIVNRQDLARIPGGSLHDETQPNLPVTNIKLGYEVSHFAVDYQNPDNKILLQAAHNNNWDATEWISEFESSVPEKKPLREDLQGINVGTMDLGSLGKYEINPRTGDVNELGDKVKDGDKNTWSLSVYTHRELCRDRLGESRETVKNIFWMSWGFSWEIIPKRIYEAYKSGKNRTLPVGELPSEDKPMALIRLDIERMEIVDSFEFPLGYFVRSPQFVPSSEPCPKDRDLSVHGYIVCVVLGDTADGKAKDEYWIFHADNFKGNPIYRLSHEELQLGLTIHSTWIPDIQNSQYSNADERRKRRKQAVERDYKELVDRAWLPKKKELFNKVVYEGFTQQILEKDLEKFFCQQGWQP
jgi:hypothetical protein